MTGLPEGAIPETPRPARPAGVRRAAAVSLFAGGFLSGVGVLLTVLWGTRAPAATAPAAAAELLVTPPPIVRPTSFTPTALADGYALGDANAPVAVEVWADFQCPYCGLFTRAVEPQIVSTYVETRRVKLVFRDLPFLGEESRWASVAARLAKEQGKFWPYHDYLFANQFGENGGAFSLARLRQIASSVGLDMAAYDEGMRIEKARPLFATLNGEARARASALAIDSTPTVVVDGDVVARPDWASIRTAIEGALNP